MKKIVEQIFDAVKADPGLTSEYYGDAVGVTACSAASQLHVLVNRGLLKRERKSFPAREGGQRNYSAYVYTALREKYVSGYEHAQRKREAERKKAERKARAAVTQPPLPIPPIPVAPTPQVIEERKAEADKRLLESVGVSSTRQAQTLDIDNMTVGEAKRIYAQLQEFFSK